ncbi:MAG TPA: hypothetical protein V6D12_20955 [Candidatus Obscuribacterales bacterium]
MSQTKPNFVELPGQAGILLQRQASSSHTKISELTPEQAELMSFYCKKWKMLALKTGPINRTKATIAVKAAYTAIGFQEPDVIFYDSPHTALNTGILSQPLSQLKSQIGEAIQTQLENQLLGQMYLLVLPLLRLYKLFPEEIDILQRQQFLQHFQTMNVVRGYGSPQMISLMRRAPSYQLKWHSPEGWQWNLTSSPETSQESLWWRLAGSSIGSMLKNNMGNILENQLESKLGNHLGNQIGNWLGSLAGNWLSSDLGESIKPEVWAYWGGYLDFYISVLNYTDDSYIWDSVLEKKWQVFQLLVKHCGWIFPFEKACIVCDRPIKLSFDNQERLHAEGEPAIQFVDGHKLYSYCGVILPEKYGRLHPHQWSVEWYLEEADAALKRELIQVLPTQRLQSQWLLKEDNAELRRLLIQKIGYERICQELQATELDSWQEYTLLRIEADVDIERIYLLKMTCPSTGFIYALRVPPNINSAREAIRWVNWGIDPENFSIQT